MLKKYHVNSIRSFNAQNKTNFFSGINYFLKKYKMAYFFVIFYLLV